MASIFVEDLPEDATEEDLKYVFSNVGTISDIRIAHDTETESHQGTAFVEFDDESSVVDAIDQYDNQHFLGKTIRVSRAKH
ncbi:RRM domain-containing RNA-binding protein [Aphelenchoides avenae]|nr:RRM domain-containing RNA-binding protein [Aphelenchus avenae]